MAFLLGESCEKVTSATELARFYTVNTAVLGTVTIDSTNGRWGGPCIKFATGSGSTGSQAWIEKYLSNASGNTFAAQFSMKLFGFGLAWGFLSVIDIPFQATQCWLRLNADLTISAMRGTTVLQTSTRSLQFGRRHFIEAKLVVNTGTSGSIDVKVDGDTTGWISTGGTNTAQAGTAGYGAFRIGFNVGNTAGSSGQWYLDDLACFDGTGGALDSFIGDARVKRCKPTAETSGEQNWTPSTGTDNSALVDEDDPNGDTDRNASSTVNDRDLFVLQDSSASATIPCYQGYLVMKKTNAGSAGVALLMQQSSTEYAATEQSPGTSYTGHLFPLRLNPATSAAITKADFDADDWGYVKKS